MSRANYLVVWTVLEIPSLPHRGRQMISMSTGHTPVLSLRRENKVYAHEIVGFEIGVPITHGERVSNYDLERPPDVDDG